MTIKGTHAAQKLLNALILLNCDKAAQQMKRRNCEVTERKTKVD